MAGQQAGKPLAPNDTGQRLDEHPLIEGHAAGQDENAPIHVEARHPEVFAEPAGVVVGRVERLASRMASPETVMTGVAGDMVGYEDTVTGLVPPHSLARFDDHPGDLVAQDNRRLPDPVPLHDVAAADAAGDHPDEQLPGADLRHGPVLDPNVAIAVVDGYLHRREGPVFPSPSCFSSRDSGIGKGDELRFLLLSSLRVPCP